MKTLEFANGDKMPFLGLGTWKAGPDQVYQAVKTALQLGYRHIDCAPIYGNEAEIGQAVSESIQEGIISRDKLWVTSKLWNDCHAPEDVQPALEKTLADLQLDYLDLYLIHWPVAHRKNVLFPGSASDFISLAELPIAKTWQAMEPLLSSGLCRHIGVSNFSIAKLKALVDVATVQPEMNQIELHPYLQQPEMLTFCDSHGIPLTAYSPLGSLDRPPQLKAQDEPVLFEDPVIKAIAERHSATPAQVLISWAIQRRTVVIPKSSNPERLQENLTGAELPLSVDDMGEIAQLDGSRRYVRGDFWETPGGPYTVSDLWDE